MHVLVIEDNSDLVANLYDFLEPRGYVVDAAYDGRSGLRLVRDNDYDVVILDLMLPDMDGQDVCSRLRDNGLEMPVLMLTARDRLEDKLAGFETGADDYLAKPFELPELLARVEALLRRVRPAAGDAIPPQQGEDQVAGQEAGAFFLGELADQVLGEGADHLAGEQPDDFFQLPDRLVVTALVVGHAGYLVAGVGHELAVGVLLDE